MLLSAFSREADMESEDQLRRAMGSYRVPGGVLAVMLAFVTVAVYLPVTVSDFINYDDHEYVAENVHVLPGLTADGAAWAFTAFHSANWHPLTWLSHMLDVSLFGLNPAGHHAMNLALHTLCVLLLLRWLWVLGCAPWVAFWVAALFAWHPAHVESVAWIAERKDVLSSAFGLLALLAYHRWVARHHAGAYLAAFLCTAASLMSKPMLVTLPALFLLLDVLAYKRILGLRDTRAIVRLLMEKAPFFLVALLVIVLTLAAQGRDGAVMALDQLPWRVRLPRVAAAYGVYLWKFGAPWPLYLPYEPPGPRALVAMAVGALVALGSLSCALWRCRNTAPLALMGWCWFLGSLAPVIGLVKAGEQFVADRYTYWPSIGLALAVAVGGQSLANRGPVWRKAVAAAAVCSLIALAGIAHLQAGYWRSSETLFRHTLARAPHNATAHNNLGTALMARGAAAEALYHFQEATAAAPGNFQAQNNLGAALLLLGKAEAAARQFEALLQHTPEDAEVWVNYGAALLAAGKNGEAKIAVDRALTLRPGAPNALRLRALIAGARTTS